MKITRRETADSLTENGLFNLASVCLIRQAPKFLKQCYIIWCIARQYIPDCF